MNLLVSFSHGIPVGAFRRIIDTSYDKVSNDTADFSPVWRVRSVADILTGGLHEKWAACQVVSSNTDVQFDFSYRYLIYEVIFLKLQLKGYFWVDLLYTV